MSSDIDAVVIIGSTLDSHLSRKIVKQLANRQVVVISINPDTNTDTEEPKLRSVTCSDLIAAVLDLLIVGSLIVAVYDDAMS